jgi:hypothetical protein
VLGWLQDDWEEGAGINGITMFWLARFFIERCAQPPITSPSAAATLFHPYRAFRTVCRCTKRVPRSLTFVECDPGSRIKLHQTGENVNSVDILLTGCEVSLWVLEQFASDLHQVMPTPREVASPLSSMLVKVTLRLCVRTHRARSRHFVRPCLPDRSLRSGFPAPQDQMCLSKQALGPLRTNLSHSEQWSSLA